MPRSAKSCQGPGNSHIDCEGKGRVITTKPHLIDEFSFIHYEPVGRQLRDIVYNNEVSFWQSTTFA
jgi:hypothetical protein